MHIRDITESALSKVLRHIRDLDDLERSIRKSKSMDKETAAEINKKRKELMRKKAELGETATAGATSAGNIATVANPVIAKHKPKKRGRYGAPQAPQKKNSDGTAKNALDVNNNLMGGKAIKR